MKRNLLVMCLSLATMAGAFAQKLVIKKSVVYVDKTTDPLASIEKVDSNTYIYKNPQGENVFKLEDINVNTRVATSFHVVNVTDLRNNKSNNIPFESLSFAFGNETVLFALISKGQYKLINDKGIDFTVLDALMDEPKQDVMSRVNMINDSVQAVIDKGIAIMAEKKIRIAADNKIFSDNTEIGNVVFKTTKDNGTIYAFFNKKTKTTIGYWSSFKEKINMGDLYRAESPAYMLFTYDNQRFRVYQMSNNGVKTPFSQELLAIMYANGIDFENVSDETIKVLSDKLAEEKRIAKENDVNIRREKGFLIDGKGERVEGEISIAFDNTDMLENDIFGGSGNIADISSYGNKVFVYAENAKGKFKSTSYKASDNVKFEVTLAKDGKVERYEGFNYDIANKTMGFLNKLASGATFFKHIYGNNKLELFYSPTEKFYTIKLKDVKNGFATTRSDQDKLIAAIKAYLGCESINLEGIDLFSLEGLKQLVDKYDTQCN